MTTTDEVPTIIPYTLRTATKKTFLPPCDFSRSIRHLHVEYSLTKSSMPSVPDAGKEFKEKQQRFMALLLPLRDRLARFARTMAASPEDAEDLIGDTMLAAFERFEKVKSPEAFLSYLFTIAVRIHRRKMLRRRFFDR